jgi:hypothetical protein
MLSGYEKEEQTEEKVNSAETESMAIFSNSI